ncbi:SRPBCC family protein [Actinoplanes sp. NPDC049265]|uniref:SRPBCC family protein n=1 Tax=Actinoplanes sp. NPDC049265 TaxID=3363902 RepID=UPI00371A6C23
MLINRNDVTVPITVFARTSAAPDHAFRVVAPIDLTTVFKADRFFPGITSVSGKNGTWDHPGVSRHPRFDDGSTVNEQLTEYVAGHGFAYELTGFTNALKNLAAGVRGEFSFLPDGGGTLIRWTYEFKPLPGRRLVIAGPFTPLWRRYMRAGLDRMVAATEAANPKE